MLTDAIGSRNQSTKKKDGDIHKHAAQSSEAYATAYRTLVSKAHTRQPWIFNCKFAPHNVQDLMAHFENSAIQSHALGTPNIDHLIILSRLNVQRAFTDNTAAVGMTLEWLRDDDSISIYNVASVGFSQDSVPLALRPTPLQRTKPHHPWIDCFPFPQIRDNLIAVEDEFDDSELCSDLMAFWDTRNSGATLLVWGFPWDPNNWEVTEGFLKKWGWIIRGCPEIMQSTNRWRTLRGEKRLTLSVQN